MNEVKLFLNFMVLSVVRDIKPQLIPQYVPLNVPLSFVVLVSFQVIIDNLLCMAYC
jgi:hypothetical protein